MAILLHLDSSPLATSISRELTAEFAKTWSAAHPEGRILYRDLAINVPTPVDQTWIYSVYTPEEARSQEQQGALSLSDELIAELEQADEYVIGVAMHNFSIPAVLKLWIDQVARKGKTFDYSSAGPQGLLKNKKATVIVASGAVYEPGSPMSSYNFADPYLRTVLAFFGVSDIRVIAAGGASKLLTGAIDRETFLKPSLELVRAEAA